MLTERFYFNNNNDDDDNLEKQTKLIAGLTLRQRALFGPIIRQVQLVFFRARVTMRKTNGS